MRTRDDRSILSRISVNADDAQDDRTAIELFLAGTEALTLQLSIGQIEAANF
jgi:hypothetical protein